MTQIEMVLNHLKQFKKITTFEAFTDYGITRLSAHIYALRKQGYEIENEYKTGKNRFGNPTFWAEYKLIEGKENG